MNLNDFKQRLKDPVNEQPKEGCCVRCNQPFTNLNVFTEAGWRETRISQVCEKCFDELFGDEE